MEICNLWRMNGPRGKIKTCDIDFEQIIESNAQNMNSLADEHQELQLMMSENYISADCWMEHALSITDLNQVLWCRGSFARQSVCFCQL